MKRYRVLIEELDDTPNNGRTLAWEMLTQVIGSRGVPLSKVLRGLLAIEGDDEPKMEVADWQERNDHT